MKASTWAWFNGDITEREEGAPSVASVNFHLGTSVFDGLMAYWNRDHYYLHRGREHLERFRAGAARMGLAFRWSVEDLLEGVDALLAKEPAATQYVRPIAYRRGPELWVTGAEGRPVDVTIFTVPVTRDVDTPLTCHVSAVERISSRAVPGHTKVSGAYVNSFFARRSAELDGFDDALMLDREGRVAEASAANVFFIARDGLVTPPVNPDVFPGITRGVVFDISRRLGLPCQERDVRPEDLPSFEGAFLCSTLMEMRPLSRLGDRALDTANSIVFHDVLERFQSMTRQ